MEREREERKRNKGCEGGEMALNGKFPSVSQKCKWQISNFRIFGLAHFPDLGEGKRSERPREKENLHLLPK